MSEKEPNKSNNTNNPILWLIIIFILLFRGGKSLFTQKVYTKKYVADLYKIDYKTLAKWVNSFAPNLFNNYSKISKISTLEYYALINAFGDITEEYKVLTKKQIAEYCDSDKRTLRNCIIKNSAHFGIDVDTYNALDKFPPRIVEQIIKAYN